MNDDQTAAEDEWRPFLGRGNEPGATEFKWGLRAGSTEPTVWEVGGPGDGFTFHNEYLATTWGREPNVASGDQIGIASWQPPKLTIQAYYSRDVPEVILDWFRAAYRAASSRSKPVSRHDSHGGAVRSAQTRTFAGPGCILYVRFRSIGKRNIVRLQYIRCL